MVSVTFLFQGSDSARDVFAGTPGSVLHGSLRGQLLDQNSRLPLGLAPAVETGRIF